MKRLAIALFAAAITAMSASAAETLPWVHDDFKQAVARAAKEGKPIFVEAWAPW